MSETTSETGSLITSGAADGVKSEADGKVVDTNVDDKGAAAAADAAKTEAAKAEEAKAAAANIEAAAAKLELKLPKGVDAKDPSIAEFKKTAAELGLDAPKAQRLFDMQQARAAAAEKARDEAGTAWLANQRKEWRASVQADPNFTKNNAAVQRVVAKYPPPPELTKFLNDGSGDHPEIFKYLARIGADLAEDITTVTKAGAPARAASADLQKMFDKSPELFA